MTDKIAHSPGGRFAPAVARAAAPAAVFLLALLALSWLQFSQQGASGTEAAFHIAIAHRLRAEGPDGGFPWTPPSALGPGSADPEICFHALLAPLAGPDDPDLLERRARGAAAFLGAALFAAFFISLRRLRAPFPLLWTLALLTGAAALIARLIVLGPTPLSLVLMVAAVPLFACRQRRHWPHFLLALAGALVTASPLLLPGLALLFTAGRRLAGERPPDWRLPVFSLAGAAAAFLLHPDPLDHARVFALERWERLAAAVLAFTSRSPGAPLADSALPSLSELLGHSELVVLPLVLLLFATLARRRRAPAAGDTLSLFLCSASFFALTAAGLGCLEHWAVCTMLLSALLLRDLRREDGGEEPVMPSRAVGDQGGGASVPAPAKRPARLVMPLFAARRALLLLLALLIAGGLWLRTVDHVQAVLAGEGQAAGLPGLRQAARRLADDARPGDVVFHTRWNHLPTLLLQAPRLRYLPGRDPLYLKIFREESLDLWSMIRQGRVPEPFTAIHGIFRATWLLAGEGEERLLVRVEHDPRFRRSSLGESVSLFHLEEREMGFLTRWLVAPGWAEPMDIPPPAEGASRSPVATAETAPSLVRGPGSSRAFTGAGLSRPPWALFPEPLPTGGSSAGHVNFRLLFPRQGRVPGAASAFCRLLLPAEIPEALILAGASGPWRVVLNGEEVLGGGAGEMALIDQARAKVRLRAGENSILVTATRTRMDWGFFLRITDLEGNPIPGMEVDAAPSP